MKLTCTLPLKSENYTVFISDTINYIVTGMDKPNEKGIGDHTKSSNHTL